MRALTCFKSYDIRGRLGPELDEAIARRIGRAFAAATGAARVVIGRDCRDSSERLADALATGLNEGGAEVLDLGLCGTEEVYFATDHHGADGGVMVTASHNPIDYNGMKLVGAGAAPLTAETFARVREIAEAGADGPAMPAAPARRDIAGTRAAYVERVAGFAELPAARPLKLVVNAGNGAAGPTFDAIWNVLSKRDPGLDVVRINHAPDPTFPNGIPNPLLAENQPVTGAAVRAHGADLGIAWDGDFDRCFLFDEEGAFVPGEYVVALLAEVALRREPGAAIVHDPRVVLNTQATIARLGGRAVPAPTGHAFLKAAMRAEGAAYGGELSAHHYFRDFMCCDSGMIPWLMVLRLMDEAPLSALVAQMRAAYPSSGEINFTVEDQDAARARVLAAMEPQAQARDDLDGLSLTFEDWRFNLRASNTEPLLRLNVETAGDRGLLDARVAELTALIRG